MAYLSAFFLEKDFFLSKSGKFLVLFQVALKFGYSVEVHNPFSDDHIWEIPCDDF